MNGGVFGCLELFDNGGVFPLRFHTEGEDDEVGLGVGQLGWGYDIVVHKVDVFGRCFKDEPVEGVFLAFAFIVDATAGYYDGVIGMHDCSSV